MLVSQPIKKDFDNHQTHHHYVNLKPQRVLSHLVQLKDPVNYDIHFMAAPELDYRYRGAISNEYAYQTYDRKTLTESAVKVGTVYRSRLSGIVVRDERDLPSSIEREEFIAKKTKLIQEVLGQIIRWVNMTGGIFLCEASSIDIYDRVLVRLYDPVTGLSINDYLLINYPEIFVSYKCGAEQVRMLSGGACKSEAF